MTPEEKQVLANHIAATTKRLLAASECDGNFAEAQKVLGVGVWLDGVETKPAPIKPPKPVKKT